MHATYNFHFLNTVSRELVAELNRLPLSVLDDAALLRLAADETSLQARQGVYVLHYEGRPVYLGKADDVHERLKQHLRKLSGRRHVDLSRVGYRALLLDRSMSTAANETVLIGLFQLDFQGMWNGTGFGPKDPGKQRDTTAPGRFDREHPIRTDFPVRTVSDQETVTTLYRKMKSELPFVFRYELRSIVGDTPVVLAGIPRTAEELLRASMSAIAPGWHAAILSYGMVVYEGRKAYGPGVSVIESGS